MPPAEEKPKLAGTAQTDTETLNRLRTELGEVLEKFANCKAQNYALECENADLKFQMKEMEIELIETRAMLGKTVVAANRNNNASTCIMVPETRRRVEQPTSKRTRSPSIEIIDHLEPPKKKEKKEEILIATPTKLSTVLLVEGSAQKHVESESTASPKHTGLPVTSKVISALDALSSDRKNRLPPLKIDPPPLDIEVPRTFLRVTYGGSDQHFLQFIQKEMNPSGHVQRRIVFPMLEMNPMMPSRPGEHGFVFASRHEILYNFPWTLFCKRNKARAVWQYLGEYQNIICGKVEAETFAAQTMEVKLAWARALLKSKGSVNDVYIEMRARIALRKYGIIPLEDKNTEEEIVVAEVLAIKADKGRELTPDEVISAICRGDESIDLIQMTCVKYDHVFANDMAAKFPNYDVLLAASKQKMRKKKVKADSVPGRPRQRKTHKSLSVGPRHELPHAHAGSPSVNSDQQEESFSAPAASSSTGRRYPQRRRESAFTKDDIGYDTTTSEESASEYED